MNEFIQALGGPEQFPYIVGGVALVIVLIGVYWLTSGGKSDQIEAIDIDDDKDEAEKPAETLVAETTPFETTTLEIKVEAATEKPEESVTKKTEQSEPVVESEIVTDHAQALAPSDVTAAMVTDAVDAKEAETEQKIAVEVEEPAVATRAEVLISTEAQQAHFFGRIKQGLGRTKANLSHGLSSLFLGAKEIDEDLLEEIETQLLMADLGVDAVSEIINTLTERVERKQLGDADALYQALKEELARLLQDSNEDWAPEIANKPYVILMVGVNGVGKTTTIGKLAKRFQAEGRSVMLAAGDTFRAAAVEQLQVWGERNNVPVVAQHTGADSASVIFDAVQSAKARSIDVVIADTAGRLQNKANLMAELEKIVRVMKKVDATAPHEVMLVLDAGTGQNALNQAKQFGELVGVSGITLTKLDGTAKGGIIFAIAKQRQLPIRFIGVGEQIDDLRPFNAEEFIAALFDNDDA